jgi:hypothetical protein
LASGKGLDPGADPDLFVPTRVTTVWNITYNPRP